MKIKNPQPNGWRFFFLMFSRKAYRKILFLQRRFLDEGIQARFLAGGGVFLDDVFLGGFVEALDRELQLRLRRLYIARLHGLARLLDGALEHTLYRFVALGLLGGHAHVLLGGIFDRHRRRMKNEELRIKN